MNADASANGLTRSCVRARTRAVLSFGGSGNPDVLLVEADGGLVVVKDFYPRGRFVRRWLGPWLLRREVRAYGRLAGVAAVPHLLGWLDEAAIVLEYRPGVLLSRSLSGRLSPGFIDRLEAAIVEMHRRGVVHLDLRHRSNVLAGRDGDPIVLDFASAIGFESSTRLGRLGVRILGCFDRRALAKWRKRLG
ncbi:MAG: hypothetical protein IPK00_07815 [Deltaproteobacteria bacterium]|nr:hypothetical protein [Deltaproteobacteria bacterium]